MVSEHADETGGQEDGRTVGDCVVRCPDTWIG